MNETNPTPDLAATPNARAAETATNESATTEREKVVTFAPPFAVFRSGGQEFKVSRGDRLRVNKLEARPGASIEFSEILMLGDEGANKMLLGKPTVSGAKVTAKVLRRAFGDKVKIFKKKRRTGYTKTQGHRQMYTEIEIKEISGI